jgi:hypothetical protein
VAADVRVKLSAEGVAEVVAALRKIRTESESAAKSSKTEFSGLNGILGATGDLFTGLAAGISVAGFVAFAKSGAEAAKQLEDLSQGAGTSIPRLQTLAGVAIESGIPIEKLQASFGVFSKKLRDFQDGVPGAESAFRKLGIAQKDLKGLDTAQAFDLIGRKIAGLPDGFQKTAIAVDLVGKKGVAVVALFNRLAEAGGLDEAEKKMRALGLVLDEDLVTAAARVDTSFEVMKIQAQNASIAMLAGLAPALDAVNKSSDEGATNIVDGWVFVGQVFGVVVKVITGLLELLTGLFQLTVKAAVDTVLPLGAALVAVLKGNLAGAGRVLKAGGALLLEDVKTFAKTAKTQFADLTSGGFIGPVKPPGTGDGTVGATAQAVEQRLALEKQLAENELKMQQALNKNLGESNDRLFKEGLISVTDYYAKRASLARSSSAAEVAAIDKRIAAEQKAPTSPGKAATISGLQADKARAQVALEGQLATIDAARDDEERKLGVTRAEIEAKIAAAQGNTHAARQVAIAQEIRAYQILLGQQGASTDEIIRKGAALDAALTAQENAATARESLDRLSAQHDLERQKVQDDLAAGTIDELDAKRALFAIDQARVPALQAAANAALEAAQATHDPTAITNAERQVEAVRNMGTAASDSQKLLRSFRGDAAQLFGQELTSLLAGGADGFQSLKAAALGALEAIIAGLRRLLAQIVASKILQLIGLGFAGGTAAASGAGQGAGGAAEAGFLAEGGPVHGPGTGTSDEVPIWASNGEWVVKAASAALPGARTVLALLNQGVPPVEIARRLVAPRYAMGGPVGGASSSVKIGGGFTVGLEDGLVARALHSPAGQRALIQVVARNPRAMRRALGG